MKLSGEMPRRDALTILGLTPQATAVAGEALNSTAREVAKNLVESFGQRKGFMDLVEKFYDLIKSTPTLGLNPAKYFWNILNYQGVMDTVMQAGKQCGLYTTDEEKNEFANNQFEYHLNQSLEILPEDPNQFNTEQGIEDWATNFLTNNKARSSEENKKSLSVVLNLKGTLLRYKGSTNLLEQLKQNILDELIDFMGKTPYASSIEEQYIARLKKSLAKLNANPSLSEFIQALWKLDSNDPFLTTIKILDTNMASLPDLERVLREHEIDLIKETVRNHMPQIKQAYLDKSRLDKNLEPESLRRYKERSRIYPSHLTWGAV